MIRTHTETPTVGVFTPDNAFTARRGPSSDVYFFVPQPRIDLVRASSSYGVAEIPVAPKDLREVRAGLMRLVLASERKNEVPPKVLREYNEHLGEGSNVFVQLPNPDAAAATISVAKVISLESSPQGAGELAVLVEGRDGTTGVLQDVIDIYFGDHKTVAS